ncbi:MAG: DUF86 domain-containing protein [candidate division NC10 bacterium]|nr:DUF86 domain-containing protein [candidate division NC10 bacterium]MDE2321383.1 DUF86 domain-containing protein [candidate division NC10 bacterium]
MMPGALSKRVIVDRLALVDALLSEIRLLPLADRQAFFADRRNVWAAESCLRRCLEALFDIGRHILAKGYGLGVSEYKEIAVKLQTHGVLSANEATIMHLLAGYRNRLVHFYHEVSTEELYQVCSRQLGDIEVMQNACHRWLTAYPERLDQAL